MLFRSMIAKIIVTGATRTQAVERARRALAETEIVGIPTVLPFHRCVLNEPAFVPADPTAPFRVHTRWIETELIDHLNTLTGEGHGAQPVEAPTERVVVEVGGKRIEVVLPAGLGLTSQRTRHGLVARRPRRSQSRATANGTTLASPMQGTIVKVAVADGARVDEGDLVVVLEAMKMEQPLVAHRAGTVTGLVAAVGSSVSAGTAICEIVDAPGE